MKTTTIALFTLFATLTGFAQNNQFKAPANAVAVINYNGAALSKQLPVNKMNSYSFIKHFIFKELGLDTSLSMEQTGIDFEKNALQYGLQEDSAFSFVTIVPIKSETNFLKQVEKNKSPSRAIQQVGNYKTLTINDDKYIGWNNNKAVLVYTNHKRSSNYYDYTTDPAIDSIEIMDSEAVVADSAKAIPWEEEEESVATNVTPPSEGIVDTASINLADSFESDLYNEQSIYIAEKQRQIADSIIRMVFNDQVISSLEAKSSYKKLIDPDAPISAWINYDYLLTGYASILPTYLFGYSNRYAGIHPNNKGGMLGGMNLYFENNKVKIETKLLGEDAETAQLLKGLYNNKQKSTLASYISPDNIAFLSGSLNTEALGKYYYRILKSYFTNSRFLGEFSDLADIYIDFLEIAIDEKAIANLAPGNFVMALHDLKPKKISYTTYEYDDNFESKRVEKTKQELAPDFTIAFETRNSNFMSKLAAVPLKYVKKEHLNYSEKAGYYQLQLNNEKDLISQLFFVVKEDRVVITTSMDMVQLSLQKGAKKLPKDLRNFVLKNNYSFALNSDKLFRLISPEVTTETNQKIKDYLQEHIGDMRVESRLKDGIIQSTGTMDIKNNQKGGLEFLFDMMENINRLMKEDEEKAEQVNTIELTALNANKP